MKLRLLALSLALASTTLAAHAQVGLYLNPVGTRISNSQADTGPFAFLGPGVTSRTFYGVDFGGYYTVLKSQSFDVSADVRDVLQHGNSAAINSFMVGPRINYKSASGRFKPYIQGSIGAARTRPGTSVAHITRFEYDIYGGLDIKLAKHVDLRAAEVSYGAADTINSGTYYSNIDYRSSKLIGVSTGFVFRFR
jgi:hypothetical protein